MITDKMIEAARAAYSKSTGVDDDHQHILDGWVDDALRSALEAALSTDQEPVAYLRSCKVTLISGGEFESLTLSAKDHPKAFPVYAAPPAPAVEVKALEWTAEDNGDFISQSIIGWYHVGLPHRTWNLTTPHGEVLSFETPALAKAAAQADYEACILSALSAQMQDVATHRHKKRGSTYTLIGMGKMQAENWRELIGEQCLVEGEEVGTAVDMREVAIYRSTDDDSLWVRPVEEFNDGRFEVLNARESK